MRSRGRAGRWAAAAVIAAAAASAPAQETTTYSYDALGRLVATGTTGTVNDGLVTDVRYDPAGNRTLYWVNRSGQLPPPAEPPPPSNLPPVTTADSLSLPVCSTATVNVTANDTDPEGNYPLALVSAVSGGKGSATVASASTIQFQSFSQTGGTTITYTVADSLGATATGTVNVTITSGICQ